jgi:hypothetical protein
VRLRESVYGGVRTIVLIPHTLVATEIGTAEASRERDSILPVDDAIIRELTASDQVLVCGVIARPAGSEPDQLVLAVEPDSAA